MTPLEIQKVVADWVGQILEKRGWSLNQLAREAGLAPGTVWRAHNPTDDSYTPTTTTISKIASAAGVAPPALASKAPQFSKVLAPTEIGTYTGSHEQTLTETQEIIELFGRGLEFFGYMPGDMVILDRSITPVEGDVVCAEVHSADMDKPARVMRIYVPPFLTTAAAGNNSLKPLLVDNDRIKIVAVAIRSWRDRDANNDFIFC